LLTRGSRAALPRQQTLRATLDWSYELLSEPERRLFNRIAVFAGGWTLEAAEAVCAGNGIDKQDNLRVGLRWWIESDDAAHAVDQAEALVPVWYYLGSLSEGSARLQELLAMRSIVTVPEAYERALPLLGKLARRHGDYALAVSVFSDVAEWHRARSRSRETAGALTSIANVHYLLADYPRHGRA